MNKKYIPSPLARYKSVRSCGLPIGMALHAFFFGGIILRRKYRKEEKENENSSK